MFLRNSSEIAHLLLRRSSESVLAVDIAQTFLPADAALGDIVAGILVKAPVLNSSATAKQSLAMTAQGMSGNASAMPHFVGRQDAVSRLAAFLESANSTCVMLYGGPGQVRLNVCSVTVFHPCMHVLVCLQWDNNVDNIVGLIVLLGAAARSPAMYSAILLSHLNTMHAVTP